jgi:hypothetical protein
MAQPMRGKSRTTIYRKIKRAVDLIQSSDVEQPCRSDCAALITNTTPSTTHTTAQYEYQTDSLTANETFENSFELTDEVELYGEVDLDAVPTAIEPAENCTSFDIADFLRDWSLRNNITLSATSQLLKGLRTVHKELPKDARTLLNTPRKVGVTEMASGEYVFLGLTDMILKHARHEFDRTKPSLALNFNVDGIPLFDNSQIEFWPILCSIQGLDDVAPFPVAVFCGVGKPPIDLFFKDFVLDLNNLISNGLNFEGTCYSVHVRAFICDAPAKAYMRCVKLYSGYYGCDRCTTKGTYVGRVTFPEVNAPLRTDASFAARTDEQFHHPLPATPLADLIDTGLVSTFPLDAMHLVYLGVTKRLLVFWVKGIKGVHLKIARMSVAFRNGMSDYLIQTREMWPSDFCRYPRGLSDVDRWKATELRQFLLYISVTAIKGFVHKEVYEHFLLLHCAITILAGNLHAELNTLAHKLLTAFVSNAAKFYGDEFIVYNVHALIHLSSDSLRLGPLGTFDAFRFENQLGILKRQIRSKNKPLQQLCKRIAEKDGCPAEKQNVVNSTQLSMLNIHDSGPTAGCHGIQFKKLIIGPHFHLATGLKDGTVILQGGRVMVIQNFISSGSEGIILIGKVFKRYSDFYTTPIHSSLLSVYFAENLANILSIEHIKSVKTKAVALPYKNGFVIFPLLHSPVPI